MSWARPTKVIPPARAGAISAQLFLAVRKQVGPLHIVWKDERIPKLVESAAKEGCVDGEENGLVTSSYWMCQLRKITVLLMMRFLFSGQLTLGSFKDL